MPNLSDPQQNKRLIQFRLCLLAQIKPDADLMKQLICYGAATEGMRNIEGDASKTSYLKAAVKEGFEVIGIDYDIRDAVEQYREAQKFVDRWFKLTNKADPWVFMRSDFCFEAMKGTGMTMREFRILSAIYSTIGMKTIPVRMTQERIVLNARGCKSAEALEAAQRARIPLPPPFTAKQARLTIDKLHHPRRLYARVTVGKWPQRTHYSHRMTDDQVKAWLEARELKNKGTNHSSKGTNHSLRGTYHSKKGTREGTGRGAGEGTNHRTLFSEPLQITDSKNLPSASSPQTAEVFVEQIVSTISSGEEFADWFWEERRNPNWNEAINPHVRRSWAKVYDDLIELDGKTHEQIVAVSRCVLAKDPSFEPLTFRRPKGEGKWFDFYQQQMDARAVQQNS